MKARVLAGLTLAGVLSIQTVAISQPAPGKAPSRAANKAGGSAPDPRAAASAGAEDQEAKQRQDEARKLFEKGLAAFDKDQWEAALSEFLLSRKAWPTRAAAKYAASCLRELHRFDESLDMFEEVLTFPNLAAKDLKFAQESIAALESKVGILIIKGGEAGASVIIDGRYRGALPLPGPLRVPAGSHEIGAFKEGGDPYGSTVEVGPKQRVVTELRSLATGGRLKVAEQRGRVLDVLVDGSVVGKTPWEGRLAVGDHLVALRGSVSLESPECAPGDEARRAAPRGAIDLGTQPVSVPIKLREVTKLNLVAEELDTLLRVEPTPGGASISIDSVVVGQGTWEGRLRVGEHNIEVSAAGFVTEHRRVSLAKRTRSVVRVQLTRDGDTPEWRASRNRWVGATFGVGALGLGVFAVTGGLALSKRSHLDSVCTGGVCPPSEQQTIDTARALGTAATVSAVVGGVALASGVVLLVAMRPPGADKKRVGGVVWSAGVGAGQVEVRGSF